MDIMYIPPEKQGLLVLYAIIIGFLCGSLCGIIRFFAEIIKKALNNTKNNKLFCIIFDLILDIISSVVYIMLIIVFIYASNEGNIRYFLILFSLSGLLLYSLTIGKLLNKLSVIIADALCRILRAFKALIYKLIRPIRSYINNRLVSRYIMLKLARFNRR